MQTQNQNRLALTQVLPLAKAVAVRVAHRPDDVDDLVQVGLFAFYLAEKNVVPARQQIRKPYADARTILQRAMWAYYTTNSNKAQAIFLRLPEHNEQQHLEVLIQNDIDIRPVHMTLPTAGLDGQVGSNGQAELLEFDDYFRALECVCGVTARVIVENLLGPQGNCAAAILETVQEKQKRQRALAKRGERCRRSQPRGVKTKIRLTHRVIRTALGLSPYEWANEMQRIRAFTAAWVTKTQNTHL